MDSADVGCCMWYVFWWYDIGHDYLLNINYVVQVPLPVVISIHGIPSMTDRCRSAYTSKMLWKVGIICLMTIANNLTFCLRDLSENFMTHNLFHNHFSCCLHGTLWANLNGVHTDSKWLGGQVFLRSLFMCMYIYDDSISVLKKKNRCLEKEYYWSYMWIYP